MVIVGHQGGSGGKDLHPDDARTNYIEVLMYL